MFVLVLIHYLHLMSNNMDLFTYVILVCEKPRLWHYCVSLEAERAAASINAHAGETISS